MKNISPNLHLFDESLWRGSPFGARSKECSPLYVDRYTGPHALVPLLDSHEWWELTAVVEGDVLFSVDPVVLAGKHELILIAPEVLHGEGTERAGTVWVGFQGERMKGVERRFGSMITVRSRVLTESVEQLWLYARQKGGAIGPELDAMTAQLIAAFLRLATDPKVGPGGRDWVGAAVEHIERHLTEPLHLPDLARQFGCSEGHFGRVFRARTGYAPILYVLRARVGRALHLLKQTNWPVAEIGRAVGFDNPFYFSRVFRRFQGQSPLQYRRK
jgi:AraC-like DNA-binding protein